MMALSAAFRALRPDHWLKNLFVLAPLVFSHNLGDGPMVLRAMAYALLFCLASSAVYLFNDVRDRERDINHPDKRQRPVASGELSPTIAMVLSVLLASVALGFAFPISVSAGVVLSLYLVNNLLYSTLLKQVVVLDVILIAMGFVLRVVGGAVCIGVDASVWLLLCTFLVSLFLGFCKRKQELLALDTAAADHRSVLSSYNLNYLDHMISVASACTVISYALYTVSEATVEKFQTDRLIFTIPFVIYGIFRYVFHINVLRSRKSTSAILLRDPSLVINVMLWFAVSAAIIYF